MKKLLLLIGFLFLSVASWGQGNVVIRQASGAPSGGCSFIQQYINSSTGDFYTCTAGTWQLSVSHGALCDSSGNCTITGSLKVGPGSATDGSEVIYEFMKPSGANYIIATTGDTANNGLTIVTCTSAVCTNLAASHIYTASPGNTITVKADAIGLTDGHWFGPSGATAATAVDCGAVTAAPTCTVAFGYVKNGGAVSANATFTGVFTGPVLKSTANYVVHRTGVGGTSSASSFATLCSVAFAAGELSAGDVVNITVDYLAYAGTGTPNVVNFGMGVTGATGTPWSTAGGTPTVNKAYTIQMLATIAVFDDTHIAPSYTWVDGTATTTRLPVFGGGASQIPNTGTDTAPPVSVSSIASNGLTINFGGFITATVGVNQTNRCVGATAYVIK